MLKREKKQKKVCGFDFLYSFAGGNTIFVTHQYLTTMKKLIAQIEEQIALFQENAALQSEKGNKAAGTRARKAALELSKLMKEFRKESVEAAKK